MERKTREKSAIELLNEANSGKTFSFTPEDPIVHYKGKGIRSNADRTACKSNPNPILKAEASVNRHFTAAAK